MVAAVRPQTALSSQTHIPRRQQICSCNTPSRPNSTPASSLKSTTSTSTQRLPCVILPGFLANTLAPTSQYAELRDSLLSLGHCGVTIIQASTWDWLPTLSGMHCWLEVITCTASLPGNRVAANSEQPHKHLMCDGAQVAPSFGTCSGWQQPYRSCTPSMTAKCAWWVCCLIESETCLDKPVWGYSGA